MIELAIATTIVAAFYLWRIGRDHGRRSAQRVTIDLGGKALIIDRQAFGRLRSSIAPPRVEQDFDPYRPYIEFGARSR